MKALLADKERLQSLSVTELKALQGIAIETGTYKAKLSQDSSEPREARRVRHRPTEEQEKARA